MDAVFVAAESSQEALAAKPVPFVPDEDAVQRTIVVKNLDYSIDAAILRDRFANVSFGVGDKPQWHHAHSLLGAYMTCLIAKRSVCQVEHNWLERQRVLSFC